MYPVGTSFRTKFCITICCRGINAIDSCFQWQAVKILFELAYHFNCGDFPNGEDLFPTGQSTTSGFSDMMVLTEDPNLLGCKKEYGKSVE